MAKLNVLIVESAAATRLVMQTMLEYDADIRIMAATSDPNSALSKMEQEWPDVIVLDAALPGMQGIAFLKKIMSEQPTPVVICSSLIENEAASTLIALAAGAVDIVTKPKNSLNVFSQDTDNDFIHAVKSAAKANIQNIKTNITSACATNEKLASDIVQLPPGLSIQGFKARIVVIGTSICGTQALELVLTSLPRVSPGIIIAQHMPEKLTAAFAERLNGLCRIEVREACHNDRILPGLALIAPGGKHILLKRSDAYYQVEVVNGPVVNQHRPSVDVFFRSVARYAGKNALGIILNGLGNDGARGLKEMHDAGASTIVQDEQTCVVFDMPEEAINLGAADHAVPLMQIAGKILQSG